MLDINRLLTYPEISGSYPSSSPNLVRVTFFFISKFVDAMKEKLPKLVTNLSEIEPQYCFSEA